MNACKRPDQRSPTTLRQMNGEIAWERLLEAKGMDCLCCGGGWHNPGAAESCFPLAVLGGWGAGGAAGER